MTAHEEAVATSEGICQECGRDNPVWWVDDDLWNAARGTPGNPRGEGIIVCPSCFVRPIAAALTQAQQMEEALRDVEWCGWSRDDSDTAICPACGEAQVYGHAADCILARALCLAPQADKETG